MSAEPFPAAARSARSERFARAAVMVVAVAASSAVTGWLVGSAVSAVAADRNAPWIVGRSAGIASYLLLVALVATGLVLAHPWRSRIRRPSSAARLRLHAALAAFTGFLTLLHVVVLATDRHAGVGWAGALLPMGSSYRPAAVTLGLVGLWAGLAAGLTAAFAGRGTGRVWWPVHKVAVVSLALVWAHGVLAGSDSRPMLALYCATGAALAVLAVSRYVARTPADRRRDAELSHRPLTRGAVR